MAWRQLETLTTNMGTFTCMQLDDNFVVPDIIVNATHWSTYTSNKYNSVPTDVVSIGDKFADTLVRETNVIVDDENILVEYGDYPNNMSGMYVYRNLAPSFVVLNTGWSTRSTTAASEFFVAILLDDENQRGYIVTLDHIYRHFSTAAGYYYRIVGGKMDNSFDPIYLAFGTPTPTYTWQSVAGVSGKGQTYNLSQIANINNGESVTGASASAFTSLTAQVSTMVTDDSAMSGADAGGISGSGSNSGDQSLGYAFGQGESGTNKSGGGGGYYGGEKGGSLLSGGAGSGYIGNSLVSNKKMVGYNVPTSSAESTKTESVSQASATPTPNVPKIGNGFARVKFVREST